jgi:glycosyltransferase involved in cell wall biosynthesis
MASIERLVSIGLPSVKCHFLEKSLISALNQTYHDIEIIIINNANDIYNKTQIKKLYLKYNFDKRLKYVENSEQLPIVENWNYTLSLAKGEYFTLLSDDDILDENYVNSMLELADKYPMVNVFYSRIARINNDGQISSVSPNAPEYEDVLDFIYHSIYGFRHLLLSAFLIKTEAIKKINGFTKIPHGIASDSVTFCKLAIDNGVVFCDKVLFNYRVNDLNTSSSTNLFKWLYGLDAEYKYIKMIVNSITCVDDICGIKKRMILRVIKNRFLIKKINFINSVIKRKFKLTYYISYPLAVITAFLIINHPKTTFGMNDVSDNKN